MTATYGREALRRHRETQAGGGVKSAKRRLPPSEAPPDAEYERPEVTLHVWNGEKWIPWRKWLTTVPIERDQARSAAFPPGTERLSAVCGESRIWLARDGDRWLMYAGAVRAANRRKDFATPFLEHAIRTAEAWYGVPADGWRAETKADGKPKTAADVPAEHSVDGAGDGRGSDAVGLDG